MTQFVALDDNTALDVATRVLRAGDVVVLPTDTVYGVATLPSSTARLFDLKGRPDNVPIAVLVDSLEQARELVEFSAEAERVATQLWPGPLTLVLRRRDGDGTLGVRAPAHDFVRALAREVGPLAVTSATRHGQPTPVTAGDAAASLTGEVALVVDGGPCEGFASTVVDLTGPNIAIVREGTITTAAIEAAALR